MISRVESNPWYGAMIAPGFAPILSQSSALSVENFFPRFARDLVRYSLRSYQTDQRSQFRFAPRSLAPCSPRRLSTTSVGSLQDL